MKVKSKSRKGGAGIAGALALLALGLSGCGLLGGDDAADKPAAPSRPAGAGFRPGEVVLRRARAAVRAAGRARARPASTAPKLAMADLNVRGGVIGQKVALVTHDDGCDAADGRASAQALKGSEVAGAVGGICAGAARAAARTLDSGLPFLVTSANAPSIVSAPSARRRRT